ncbi:MAG TPA: hypothetical protein VJH06_03515 [Candidatus Paceibacterota bacterium]
MSKKSNFPKKILISTFVPVQSAEKNLADKKKWQGLKNFQIFTFQRALPEALEYHFTNFKKLEEKGVPALYIERYRTDEEWVEVKQAQASIKFEIQAYLCQLRRASFFINSLKLTPPQDLELKEIWDSIIEKEGMANTLSNKWASHRSIDYPRGEDDSLHTEVLLSLEGGATSWSGKHLILLLSNFNFNLCDFHPKVLKFIQWMFTETEKLYVEHLK